MKTRYLECSSCGADYDLGYDPDESNTEPLYCPFCGEFLSNDDDEEFADEDEWEE